MNARAVASACAKLGLECEVHIGAVDAEKVSLNKDITELYGAKISRGVRFFSKTTTSLYGSCIKKLAE